MPLPRLHCCSLSMPLPSMQAPSLKTALSSGSLNPTAAEFVPGGLSAMLTSKVAPLSDQLRSPSPAFGEASKPPKGASKVILNGSIHTRPQYTSFQAFVLSSQSEEACCEISREGIGAMQLLAEPGMVSRAHPLLPV